MDCPVFLGVSVHSLSLESAVAECLACLRAENPRTSTFVHVNPHSLVQARSDAVVREALAASDLRFADGAGLLLVSRIRGRPLAGRVAGPDLLEALSDALERRGGARYFFYGSSEDVLRAIRARVAERWPSLTIAGALSPPFRTMSPEEEAEHVRIINAARPDVLWVGMTAPKQECWVQRNRASLRVPLVGSVGAAFDFLAGTKRRSPAWFRERGLEWLARLFMEPSRLWRRTVVSAPLFLWYALIESFTLGKEDR